MRTLLSDLPTFSLEPEPITTQGYLPRCLRELNPQVIQGTRINKGAAIARPQIMQSLTFTDIIARNPGYIGNIESEKARFLTGLDALRVEQEAALGKNQGIEHDLIAAHLSLTDGVSSLNRGLKRRRQIYLCLEVLRVYARVLTGK